MLPPPIGAMEAMVQEVKQAKFAIDSMVTEMMKILREEQAYAEKAKMFMEAAEQALEGAKQAEQAAKAAANEGEELRKELRIPQELVRQNVYRAEAAANSAHASHTAATHEAERAIHAADMSEQWTNAAKSRMESTFVRLCTLTEGIDSRCERLGRMAEAAVSNSRSSTSGTRRR